jgi:hypothetical protein
MKLTRLVLIAAACSTLVMGTRAYGIAPTEISKEHREFFEAKIRPILSQAELWLSCCFNFTATTATTDGKLERWKTEILVIIPAGGRGVDSSDAIFSV